ncbi:hypothetical protein [Nonomuraea sp. LPB2021202275-12-8]|uniref:hypothetical protein n=1 Tax=Nonomuraea sp. LPB2021202275-12-8 TaxID=3120159 RepID=UPI00300C29CE
MNPLPTLEVRRSTLKGAGRQAGETATHLRGALDELLAAISAAGPIPRNDDISAMIAAAYAAIHEIGIGSIESAVAGLGGHGERLSLMATEYAAAEEDTEQVLENVDRAWA